MFGQENYAVLDLNDDVEVSGSYEGLEMKCPRCNRKKSLSYFFDNDCECGLKLEFKIKATPPQDEEPEGFL